jgi:hypothetical protein
MRGSARRAHREHRGQHAGAVRKAVAVLGQAERRLPIIFAVSP